MPTPATKSRQKRSRRTNETMLQVWISSEDMANLRAGAAAIHPELKLGPYVRDLLRAALAQRMAAPIPEQPKAA